MFTQSPDHILFNRQFEEPKVVINIAYETTNEPNSNFRQFNQTNETKNA